MKYFDLYQLPVSFFVDEEAVKRKFLELSRKYHPDFFVNEAEEKLRKIKGWSSEFEHRSQVLVKDLEHVRSLMANEMPKAVAHLVQVIRRIDEYVRVGMAPMPGEATSAAESTEIAAGGDARGPDSK